MKGATVKEEEGGGAEEHSEKRCPVLRGALPLRGWALLPLGLSFLT